MSRPTFFGLNIAVSGLTVAQRQLDVTGHNIVNADTKGYTRQRLIQESIEPGMNPWFIKQLDMDQYGMGVRVNVVEQIRDVFLDRQYRSQNSMANMWDTRANNLDFIQTMFPEKLEIGLTNAMQRFYTSWQELSKNPVDGALRVAVRNEAENLVYTFHSYNQQLVDYQKLQNDNVASVVGQINSIAHQIAKYNEAIANFETPNEPANDLRDKRNLLLDELSSLVDFTYSYDSSNLLTVSIGGQELVAHKHVNEIMVTPSLTDAVTGQTGLYNIVWSTAPGNLNSGAVDISSGQLRAHMDLRDGNTSNNIGIPYIVDQLNILAKSLVDEINKLHTAGFTQAQDGIPSVDGIFFFDPMFTSASDISLNTAIIDNVFLIAAADAPTTGDPAVDNADNNQHRNQTALDIAALFNSDTLMSVGSYEGFIRGLIVTIATQVNLAQNSATAEETSAFNLDNLRASISGVNTDEELTNMLKFQNAYSASARLITAMDEALDKLINGTGVVGR